MTPRADDITVALREGETEFNKIHFLHIPIYILHTCVARLRRTSSGFSARRPPTPTEDRREGGGRQVGRGSILPAAARVPPARQAGLAVCVSILNAFTTVLGRSTKSNFSKHSFIFNLAVPFTITKLFNLTFQGYKYI